MLLNKQVLMRKVGQCQSSSRRTVSVTAEAGQKQVFITGGNTGIGFETAKELCNKGYAVTIAGRDSTKITNAMDKIRASIPGAQLSMLPLDLSDLVSVADCAKRVLDSGVEYNVWINNAGVMATPPMKTKQGFEFQLGTNHLGHFLLTTTVLPALKAANKPVRVINVASSAHEFGKIDFNNLMREKFYTPWDAYGQSKLANVMFSYEMQRRVRADPNITVHALHPGVVNTELGRYMVNDSNKMFMGPAIWLASAFFKTPPQGAETSIYLASTAEEVEGGKYWSDCKRATTSAASYDKDVAEKLWQRSAELIDSVMPAAASAAAM